MHGNEQPSEAEAFGKLLKSRFPWMPEDRVLRASEAVTERVAALEVENERELTPSLLKAAVAAGHSLAQEFLEPAPSWETPWRPPSPPHRSLLGRLGLDLRHRV